MTGNKLIAAVVGFCLAIGTAGAADAPAAKKRVVAFAQDTLANDWRTAQVRDVATVLARHPGIEFMHTDAKGDSARQVKDIEDLAALGIDVLIASPRDAELMREPLARVHRRGIPVILLTRRVSGDEYAQFISADNRAIARQAAQFLARRLKGKGNILMLQGVPTASSAIERTAGFLDEIARHPGIKVTAILPADYLRTEAIKRVEEALAQNLPFDAIYSQSDSMALGAILALKKAGRDPKRIPITGIDYIAEGRAAIRAGELAASFTFPTAGREGAEAALRLLRGGRLPKAMTVPSVAVTRENVDQVAPIF